MAPFRGRGGRGGRGGFRGGRGGNRGGGGSGKLARSGIRTRNGYKRFDSQRVKDVDDSDDDQQPPQEYESEDGGVEEENDDDDEDIEEVTPAVKAYNTLLQSFGQPEESSERKAKRRKIEEVLLPETANEEEEEVEDALADEEDGQDDDAVQQVQDQLEDDYDPRDPFETHFANPEDNELQKRLDAVQSGNLKVEKGMVGKHTSISVSAPSCVKQRMLRTKNDKGVKDLYLKARLAKNMQNDINTLLASELDQTLAPYLFEYQDVMLGTRTTQNAASLRRMASLHAVNHILKGRDKVLKNNERQNHAQDTTDMDLRDQGFVRPKVLVLLETRQMATRYADSIVEIFQPDQQENRKRFDDSFTAPIDQRDIMPQDYRELFGGNNDNSFLTALKFTRKSLKFYSAFYNSDIILASPLGLRRIIENEDAKKRDYDFLSSIEVVVVDQADAMYMQNWENVEIVLRHMNLELKEAHGCDFSRVRNWYLDGNSKYLRQTVVFSGFITPELNRLYNTGMLNVTGKVKFTDNFSGAIVETSGLGIKQTFLRYDSLSPTSDPDARFKYFTSAILPGLLRLPKPSDGAQGTLIFIPTYYDFLRLRNFFATSTQTENISFGTIHDYSEVSDQRRARSHFMNGRHSILLYTQRAHHFFRLRIKGVKRVVMYGLPDNSIFYQEMVEGFLGTSVQEGKIDAAQANVKNMFSRWDGLRLERVVGSQRVKGMLGGVGDTFDFV